MTPTPTPAQRRDCARQLSAALKRTGPLRAFVGLDGFVDEILHVVDKRESAEKYVRLPQMGQWGERIQAAAGRSTNIELVSQMTKLGGNGPIMANALASFGLQVTYLGLLGYPNLHPVFAEFAQRAKVHSIAEPGYTDAVEFEDGKVMLGKHQSLKQLTWANIKARFGQDQFAACLDTADLVGFVNWTMLPYMSDVWDALLKELCPKLKGPRRILFFDLADPEKRLKEDLLRALKLIVKFGQYFDVILGLNEKEAHEVARALDLDTPAPTPVALASLGRAIYGKVPVQTLVIHPVAHALAISAEGVALTSGPTTAKPLITTGAGDHFNSGFCLGRLFGLDNHSSLLAGVTCSGFYVRTAKSPSVRDLARMLQDQAVKY
jgi:sugar/nucleoside kinase (ribokinase family)